MFRLLWYDDRQAFRMHHLKSLIAIHTQKKPSFYQEENGCVDPDYGYICLLAMQPLITCKWVNEHFVSNWRTRNVK